MPEVDVLKITNDDAAFVLGKNGKTKEKIARVSGAELDLFEQSLTLEIRGTAEERKKAKKYVECVMAQRIGPVTIVENSDDDDLTVVMVPSEAVGFVTGSQGNFLRQVEEEWGTLMFFADFRGRGERQEGDMEKLAIFGNQRARRGAQLKVMAAVETKMPGYFTTDVKEGDDNPTGFGTHNLVLKPDDLSYALGKKGMTRKKLARSSGCIVEYVGYTVFMSGMPDERQRAKEYLTWLFDQLRGPVYVDGWESRDDCTMVDVPRDCVGYVTGARRATLSKIEEEWGTLMFFMSTNMRRDDRGQSAEGRRDFDGSEKLAIFGDRRGRRGAELKCMSAVETKRPGYFTKDVKKHTSEREGFASDTILMDESELSYALGKDGATRRKLARASGCIMEYVGQVAFICGTIEERTRARTYLKWLLKQRSGSVYVEDLKERTDVTIVPVPREAIGYVTGNRGSSLRQVEEDSGTFCFVEGGRGESEQLLIFGHNKPDRELAERLVNGLINEKMRGDGRRFDDRGGGGYDDRDRGRGGYEDRRPDDRGGGSRGYDRREDRDRGRDYDRRDDRDRGRDYDRRDDRDRGRDYDRDRDRDRDRRGGRDYDDDRDERRGREYDRDRRDDDYDRRRGSDRDRRGRDDDYDDRD
jgi:rRNA processing protein Krr1/Pno1